MSDTSSKKILKLAAKIIADEGLDSLSFRYVCEKASVKAHTVCYYFQDKDELNAAAIGLAYQKHITTYSESVKDNSPISALIKPWDSFFWIC